MTSVELESISLLKWQSWLQMPWLVVVWTIVTLCSEVCSVSISTSCKVFRTPLLVLLQIIESMLMLHPFYRNSIGCRLSIVVFSKPQHLCINFCIVVLPLTSNRSCLLVVVPIVLGIVTQIVNTLQFLLSIHQSLSQPNILAIVLPLMLLRSGMTSLKMLAVQHQLPPSERSLKHMTAFQSAKGLVIARTLLDLSAAFGTIDHAILLDRRNVYYGISELALSWFKSYLSGRTHSVKVDGTLLHPAALQYGVPQGSVIGPILFSLYTNPISSIMHSHSSINHHFYADDTQLYITLSPTDFSHSIQKLKNCFNNI